MTTRRELIELRMRQPGLSGTVWHRLARELQGLRDADPEAASAHVLAWRARLSAATSGQVPAPRAIAPVVRESRVSLRTETMEAPLTTEALRQAKAAGETSIRTHEDVVVNHVLRVGGLAYMTGVGQEEAWAAATYREAFELAQLGGARALDYEVVKVDVSGPSASLVDELGMDARQAYGSAQRAIGLMKANLVEHVVCYELSLREVARRLEGDNDGARKRLRRQLLEALGQLAAHFGYLRRQVRVRGSGEVAREIDAGLIVNRRMACALV